MFNIQRRQGALILMGFVLVAGQCYFVMRKHNIRQLAVVEMLLTEPQKNVEFSGKEESNAEKEPTSEISKPGSTKELYELMDKYAQAKLSDIDPPFKKILFWNEVRAYHDHLSFKDEDEFFKMS